MAEWVDDFGNKLVGVHETGSCRDTNACSVHSPSNHPLSTASRLWRQDRGFMERICVHGVGHPDEDDHAADPVHTCDGCCTSEIP